MQVIQALTPAIAAVGTIISGFNAYQISRTKARVKEASAKLDAVADKADVTTAKVVEVHACLDAARTETATGIAEVKEQASAVAQAAIHRENEK